MTTEHIDMINPEGVPLVRISVTFRPGRWGKEFHIFDLDNREIVLHQKEALKLAHEIIKIASAGRILQIAKGK